MQYFKFGKFQSAHSLFAGFLYMCVYDSSVKLKQGTVVKLFSVYFVKSKQKLTIIFFTMLIDIKSEK